MVPDGRARRAEFLGVDEAEFERRDRRLDTHEGDYVLWFEADLYDQLQIVEILARLRDVDPARIRCARSASTSASRTSAGSASSTPEQLRELPGGRAHRRRAARSPRAPGTRSPRPSRTGCSRSAARPSCASWARRSSGSRRSTRGAATASRCPSAGCSPARPARSTSCSSARGARSASVPGRHVRVRSGSTGSRRCSTTTAASCASTTRGERVLAGEEQFVTERWIGGVHVTPETPWRWDDAREAITSNANGQPNGQGPGSGDLPWRPVTCQGHAPYARAGAARCRPRRRTAADCTRAVAQERTFRGPGRRQRQRPRPRHRVGRRRRRTAWCRSRSRWTGTGCSTGTRCR